MSWARCWRLVLLICLPALVSCSLILSQQPACLVDSDCGQEGVCDEASGLCRELVSGPDCGELIGSRLGPESLLLGFVAPLSGENTESGLYLRRAVELAVDEINNVGGVGGRQGGKPLAVLLCDDQGDPEVGERAARYLAEVAGVPAIIGAAFSMVTAHIAQEVAIPSGTLLISPASTAVALSALADQNLVWRTVAPDSRQADTMAHFATWEVLQAAGVSAQGEASASSATVEVAMVAPDDVYGNGLMSSFEEAVSASVDQVLRFSVDGLALGTGGLDLRITPFYHVPGDPDSMAQAAAQVADLDPDVVLLVGYDESAGLVGQVLSHQQLATSASLFLADGLRSDDLGTFLGSSADSKPRLLFGTNPGGRLATDGIWLGFRDRYAQRWSEPVDELHNYVENAYDATYLLAYALAATDSAQPAGSELAAALARVNGGAETTLLVGEDDALRAFNAFGGEGALKLRGASGEIAFDGNGDPQAGSVLRWDVNFQAGTSTWSIDECGIATSYDVSGGRVRDWCAAYCTESIPVQTDGDDDDSADGDDDDSADGDDDDSTPAPADPCRPPVMG